MKGSARCSTGCWMVLKANSPRPSMPNLPNVPVTRPCGISSFCSTMASWPKTRAVAGTRVTAWLSRKIGPCPPSWIKIGHSSDASLSVHALRFGTIRAPAETQKKSGRSCDRPELFSETICARNYTVCFLRNIRSVLAPNGSSSIAPATIVVGSGTGVTIASKE